MNLKRRKNQYATARERFIKPALMNFLKVEFPFLGGERVRMLFVEELMKILDKLIMCYDPSYLSELRLKYEKRKATTLHFTGYDHDMGTAISHKTAILRKIFLEKKDPVQVARETDHSPEAVGKYCQQFNKVKWCVENEIGKEEIRIVTGMKTHFLIFLHLPI